MTEPRSPRTQPLTMNAQQLEALLPHRYPFALVDHNACLALRRWEG